MPLLAALALALLAAALIAMATTSPPVNYYLLPVGDPRCRNAASRLRCLDQSVLLAASDAPDESLLDSYLLCNSTWAALGCQQEDVGAVAWRLAFRLAAVPCGHRVVFADSPVNPLQRPAWLQYEIAESESDSAVPPSDSAAAAARLAAAGVVTEFTCRSHSYPHVHRPAYRFTRLTWHRDSASSASALATASTSASSAAASSVAINITAHVYALFRSDLSAAERAAECDWRGGFRCRGQLPQLQRNDSKDRLLLTGGGRGGGETCVYGTHRCNGYDDCLDAHAADASASAVMDAAGGKNATTTGSVVAGVSSDELDCSFGGASGLFNFWPQAPAAAAAPAAAHPPSSAAAALAVAAFPAAFCLLLMRC